MDRDTKPLVTTALATLAAIAALAVGAWLVFFRTPLETQQIGYRGVAMETPRFADDAAALVAANVPPAPVYDAEPDDGSEPRAGEIYENVQVLGHLSDANFNRLMAQITEWVAPEQGCNYCHGEDGNFASDAYYPKLVARRMLQMTQTINAEWTSHVGAVGVTCYTCHRGQNVPSNLWFLDPAAEASSTEARFIGEKNGQNTPVAANGYTSMAVEPYSAYLGTEDLKAVRVQDQVAITTASGASIQDTEHLYALMINWSKSLGVNCTYCHNSRAFTSWETSPPTRVTAWHGRQMVKALNGVYLDPLQPVYPAERLGPLGDAPKLYCATCHIGAPKPLLGADMVSAFPELKGPGDAAAQDAATWPATGGPAPAGWVMEAPAVTQ